MKNRLLFLGVLFSVCQLLYAVETLVMTAPPRESKKAGKQQYEITANYISKVIGRPVKYEHPGNWLTYQFNMRKGKYDIVFDGPHFASWRMVHQGHDMLVKLPGDLQFYLLIAADNGQISSPDDLIGKNICGISPPNLSTLSILARFRNPVRQPVIKGIKGGMGAVYKTFKTGACEAMVLRSTYYKKKLTDDDRNALKIIFKSPVMPNQVISAGKRLTANEKARLQLALIDADGVAATQPTLKRFGGKSRAFVPANDKEYKGYNELLEGVIFGW